MALPSSRSRYAIILAGLLVLAISGLAQRRFRGQRFPEHEEEGPRPDLSDRLRVPFHSRRVYRPAAISSAVSDSHRATAGRRLVGGGLARCRRSLFRGRPAADPNRHGRSAAPAPHRRHTFRLPLDLCDANRLVGPDRRGNRAAAGIPAAGRIPGDGRFLGRRIGKFSAKRWSASCRTSRSRTSQRPIR